MIDPLDIFDHAEETLRRESLDAARERNKILDAQVAQEKAERQAKADALSRRANQSVLVTEYVRAGVDPISVNDDGIPTVSLSFLISIGWTIEDFGGRRTLVKPPMPEPRPRRKNHDIGS